MGFLKGINITKSYDNILIVEDINITAKEGELISLLGKSGVGKSTLFNILAGLLPPDSGQVILNNEDITTKSGKISYMQQKNLLLPFKTIIDNVCIPLILKDIKRKEAYDIAYSFFDEFGISGSEYKYPSQLSGGMQKRASLLRAYLFSKTVMLLDEPFSALDYITRSSMYKWFKLITKKHNTTSILITHDIDEAILLSDKIYIMAGKPGKIINEIDIVQSSCYDEFIVSEEFIRYKRNILEILNKTYM